MMVDVVQTSDMVHKIFFVIVKSHSDWQLTVTMIEITFQTELLLTIDCCTITITLVKCSPSENKAR